MAFRAPERSTWAVAQLPGGIRDPILEVGCGAVLALALLLDRYPDVALTAIDRSPGQVARARARHGAAIAAGRLRVEPLGLATAPAVLGAGAFAHALAINVNAFWTAPAMGFGSLARLLGPAGLATLVYEPPSPAARRRLEAELPARAEAHGFRVTDVRLTRFRSTLGLCVVAATDGGASRATG